MIENSPEAMLSAAGSAINQSDWPWWVDRIVSWQRMVRQIYDRSGHAGHVYQGLLAQILDWEQGYVETDRRTGKQSLVWGPAAIWGLFEDFITMCKTEDQKR